MNSKTGDAVDDAAREIKSSNPIHSIGEAISGAAHSVSENAKHLKDKTVEVAHNTYEKAGNAVSSAEDSIATKASQLKESVVGAKNDNEKDVKSKTNDALEATSQTIQGAKTAVSEKSHEVAGAASRGIHDAGDSISAASKK